MTPKWQFSNDYDDLKKIILPIMSSKGSKSFCTLSAYFSWIGRTGTRSKLVFCLKLLIFRMPLMFELVWNLFQLDFHVNNNQKIMVLVVKVERRHAHAHSCWMKFIFSCLFFLPTPTPWLTWISITRISLTQISLTRVFTNTRFQNSLTPWLTHIA